MENGASVNSINPRAFSFSASSRAVGTSERVGRRVARAYWSRILNLLSGRSQPGLVDVIDESSVVRPWTSPFSIAR
jgi:hypothetical protein